MRPKVDDSVVVLYYEKVYLSQVTETDTDYVHIQISCLRLADTNVIMVSQCPR